MKTAFGAVVGAFIMAIAVTTLLFLVHVIAMPTMLGVADTNFLAPTMSPEEYTVLTFATGILFFGMVGYLWLRKRDIIGGVVCIFAPLFVLGYVWDTYPLISFGIVFVVSVYAWYQFLAPEPEMFA